MSGLIVVLFGLALPKFRPAPPTDAHRSPPAARLSCAAGLSRLQSTMKLRLPSVHASRRCRTRSDARDDARRGIVRAVDDVAGRGFEILAAVELERRLAVAEQIVGDAESRRDVVVAAHAHGRSNEIGLGLKRDVSVVPLPSAGAQLQARS